MLAIKINEGYEDTQLNYMVTFFVSATFGCVNFRYGEVMPAVRNFVKRNVVSRSVELFSSC
jgi:hypothetical protein